MCRSCSQNILCLMVMNCTDERFFSQLKRIKSDRLCERRWAKTARLNSLSLLKINCDATTTLLLTSLSWLTFVRIAYHFLYASAVRRSARLCNSSPLGTEYSESNFYAWKGALNGIFKYDVIQILMGVNLTIAVLEIHWRRLFDAWMKLAQLIYKYIDYLCLLGIWHYLLTNFL